MKKILSWLGTTLLVVFSFFTCNMIGQINLTKDEEEIKEQVLVSIESDLPADFDLLVDSMASDIREYARIPDTIHVMYGQYGKPVETFDTLRGANLISSHGDTLFITPIDPGLLKYKVHPRTSSVIGMKILEMVKK